MANTQEIKNLKLWISIFLFIFHGSPIVWGPGTDFLAFSSKRDGDEELKGEKVHTG